VRRQSAAATALWISAVTKTLAIQSGVAAALGRRTPKTA